MQIYQKLVLAKAITYTFVFAGLGCSGNFSLVNYETSTLSIDDHLLVHDRLMKVIEPKKKKLDELLNHTLTISNEELVKDKDQNLGNLVADLVFKTALEYAESKHLPLPDGCILNSGGLRSALPKGEIKVRHIFELMPFENEIVIVTIHGKDLKKFTDLLLKEKNFHPVSQVHIKLANDKVDQFTIQNKPLDENRTYVFVTNDYMFNGGDNMHFFGQAQSVEFTGIKLRDALIEQMAKIPIIQNYKEQRIQIVD